MMLTGLSCGSQSKNKQILTPNRDHKTIRIFTKLKNKLKRESLKNYAEHHTERQEDEQEVGKMKRQGLQSPTSPRKVGEKENAGMQYLKETGKTVFFRTKRRVHRQK